MGFLRHFVIGFLFIYIRNQYHVQTFIVYFFFPARWMSNHFLYQREHNEPSKN